MLARARTPAAVALAERGRGATSSASARVGTAGSNTRCACCPSTSITCPAWAGPAATAVMATARSAVLLTYPIRSSNASTRAELRSRPATLRRVRRALPVLLFAALVLSSCGGGEDTEDVQNLLDKAFSNSINSADLKVDASIQLKGSPSLDKPVRISATGPFRSNEGKLPSADIELKVGDDGGGQTITTGFLSTGDRAFVKFQDVYYEQPRSQVAKANASLAQNKGKRGSLSALGLDPRSWLAEAKDEGEEEVAGVKTRHVSGKLDVEAVMRNLNQFVKKSGAAFGGATGQAPPKPLSEADIQKVGEVVKDPTFNVYVGEDDDIIRRVAGKIEFDVPEAEPAEPRRDPVRLDRVPARVLERERRPADRGAGQRAADVGADPLARRRGACRGSAPAPAAATPRVPDNATPRGAGLPELRGLPRQGAARRTPRRCSAAPTCCSGP